jgi:adenylosuccinate synthase
MPASVIVGLQWGDEGKGKTTDFLAEQVSTVVRYQGGDNAGHTIVIGDDTFNSLFDGRRATRNAGVLVDRLTHLG